MGEQIPKRFWEKVKKNESSGCWEWSAAKNTSGYGYFRVGGRNQTAHRYLYQSLHGELPKDIDLDHTCRNRVCVNPSHLEPVTRRENLLRGDTIPAKHAQKTHCPKGHEYTEENTYVYGKTGSRYCKECRRIRSSEYYYTVTKKRSATNE